MYLGVSISITNITLDSYFVNLTGCDSSCCMYIHTSPGTSFSSPYTAGLLAMWLQHKQKQAALANVRLDPATVSHDAALRGLVATAKGVKDPLKATYLEPVARMGAGEGLD